VNITDFKNVKGIGQGAYGKVMCVISKVSQKQYALKIISKRLVQNLRMQD
jgi:serine/threonine protein kinase